MERYKLKQVLLTDKDLKVLMESLGHAAQRGDIPWADRERARNLRDRLGEQFKFKE